MVYVILRNRKVLKYNQADTYSYRGDWIEINYKGGDGHNYLISHIPCDVVERVEWIRPCEVLKEKPIKAIKKIY